MAERRNAYTAVLFLVALFSAVLFLLAGLIPHSGGFMEEGRPPRPAPVEVKTKFPAPEPTDAEKQERGWSNRTPADNKLPERTCQRAIRGHITRQIAYEELDRAVTEWIDSADPAVNGLLDRNHLFIELYGGVQRLLGRRVIEDPDPQYTVVRLTDKLLTFANLEPEPFSVTLRANEMIRFARRVKAEYKIPVLYVQAPSKLNVHPLPDGMTDYSEAEADRFLEILGNGKVDTLDLRPIYQTAADKNPEAAEELFYRTDHHWTPAGAFLGYQALAKKLNRWPYHFQIDPEWIDPDNFTTYTFEKIFLGSQGRRVGSLYAGLDHFDVWSPKFSTDFTYSVPNMGIEREGPFVTSLLFPERLSDTGLYDTNPYTIYAGGDYLLTRAVNNRNPGGKRVLVLRDSFGCVLTPFLALGCQEVMAIDPRNFNGNQDTMMYFIDWLQPDLVIVLNAASSLRVDSLFPYLPTARLDALAARRENQ